MLSLKTLRVGMSAAVIALSCFTTFTTVAQADDSAKPPTTRPTQGTALDRFQSLVKSLNLTDEQKPKIDHYFDAARKEMKAAESGPAADRDKKAAEISTNLRNEIGDVLTNEQKAQLLKIMPKQPDKTDATIANIKRELNKPESKLTADQKEKVNAVLDDTQQKLDDLKAEAREKHTDVRPQIQAVLKDMRTKLSEILSPK